MEIFFSNFCSLLRVSELYHQTSKSTTERKAMLLTLPTSLEIFWWMWAGRNFDIFWDIGHGDATACWGRFKQNVMLRSEDQHSKKEYPIQVQNPPIRNPRKLGMYYEFSQYHILQMQQLKVLIASSIKTVLWNARFSMISIYGYFEPIWNTLSCCGSL